MALIGANLDRSVSLPGLLLVLGPALCWAGSNLVVRAAGRVDALAFMVWASVVAAAPLALLSLVFEGPAATVTPGALPVPVFGMSPHGRPKGESLSAQHEGTPVSASALVFTEALPGRKLGAAALVIAGLALDVLASRSVAVAR